MTDTPVFPHVERVDFHSWRIGDAPYPGAIGVDLGPKNAYKVGPLCAAPLCRRLADHAHHLWGRGYMGKAYNWVEVHEEIVPNLIGLCWQHHRDVTGGIGGYRAGIQYHLDGTLWWHSKDGDRLEMLWTETTPTPAEPVENCSECGRRKPRKRDESLPKGEKRPKAEIRWKVPSDEREAFLEALSELKERYGRAESEPPYYAFMDAVQELRTLNPNVEAWSGEGNCPTCGRSTGL